MVILSTDIQIAQVFRYNNIQTKKIRTITNSVENVLFEESLLKIVIKVISLVKVVMGTINQDSQFDFFCEKYSHFIYA